MKMSKAKRIQQRAPAVPAAAQTVVVPVTVPNQQPVAWIDTTPEQDAFIAKYVRLNRDDAKQQILERFEQLAADLRAAVTNA